MFTQPILFVLAGFIITQAFVTAESKAARVGTSEASSVAQKKRTVTPQPPKPQGERESDDVFRLMNNIAVSRVEEVKALLDKGVDVNSKARGGMTPLMLAATVDHRMQIIEMLLAKGANVNIKDGLGRTPLMLAIAAKMPGTKTITPALIQLLIDNKADLKAKNNDGETVLKFAKNYAATYRDNSIVELLIKAGARE